MAQIDLNRKPNETQERYYKRLAKAADRRLRDIEKLSQQSKYSHVKEWAYKNAMYDLNNLYGSGKNRFDVVLPKNKKGTLSQKGYMARINAVKRFLEAPSSLKSEIDAIYDKRATTMNDTYGTKFTWQSIGKVFEKGQFQKMEKIFGSKTAMKVIGKLQQNGENVKKAIKSIDARTIRSSKGQAAAKEKFLKQWGIKEEDLFVKLNEDETPLPFKK